MFKYNFCNMVTSFLGKILRVGLTEPRVDLTIKAVRKLLHPTKTPIEQCCPTITVLLNARLLLCLTQRPLMHTLASKHWISPTAEEGKRESTFLVKIVLNLYLPLPSSALRGRNREWLQPCSQIQQSEVLLTTLKNKDCSGNLNIGNV